MLNATAMATWVAKIVIRTAKNQNVYAASYTIQSRDFSSKPRIIKNPTTASLKRGTGGRSSFNGIVCTIFGCNGFVGPYVCNRLGKIGTQLILPHRCDHYHVRPLKLCGDLGQVLFHPFDLKDEESIIKSIKYSNVVINLVGSNYETNNFDFYDVHVEGARRLAKLAKQCNVERFIHVSCSNAEEKPTPLMLKDGSKILKTKWLGECAVKEEFPEATIIRPSVIYGQEDSFLSHYMNTWRSSFRTIPMWESGEKTEKQPVHISDVASGITAVVLNPSTAGKTYQFIGPKRYKLSALVKWLYEIAYEGTEIYFAPANIKHNPLFSLRVGANEFIRSIYSTIPLSWEVLEMHHVSDKVIPGLPTLEDLGITPISIDTQIMWEMTLYKNENYLQTLGERLPPKLETIPSN